MTTLISKLQETNQRFQQLTVWRPTDRDPFIELDRWRLNAHAHIEQIYLKKRQQIEQLMDKHEREFMRHIARQRTMLNSVRKRLAENKEINSYAQAQNESSILMDLQRIENDIQTKLGRAEILIETATPNFEGHVIISLKTYLSSNPMLFTKELSTINLSKKPTRRSTNAVIHAYETWLDGKKQEEAVTNRRELQSAREHRQRAQENFMIREQQNKETFKRWVKTKESTGAFVKKTPDTQKNDTIKETNET